MDDVKVKRPDLLEVVRANRQAHRDLFDKAQAGFRARVIEELDRRLADAKAGRAFNIHFGLPAPIDQTKDYDRAIRMLEMSIDDVIELSQGEFAQYVMDDWSWKANVMMTNTAYTVGR